MLWTVFANATLLTMARSGVLEPADRLHERPGRLRIADVALDDEGDGQVLAAELLGQLFLAHTAPAVRQDDRRAGAAELLPDGLADAASTAGDEDCGLSKVDRHRGAPVARSSWGYRLAISSNVRPSANSAA